MSISNKRFCASTMTAVTTRTTSARRPWRRWNRKLKNKLPWHFPFQKQEITPDWSLRHSSYFSVDGRFVCLLIFLESWFFSQRLVVVVVCALASPNINLFWLIFLRRLMDAANSQISRFKRKKENWIFHFLFTSAILNEKLVNFDVFRCRSPEHRLANGKC